MADKRFPNMPTVHHLTRWLHLLLFFLLQTPITRAQNATDGTSSAKKCPILPPTKIRLNLTEDFVTKAAEAMELNLWATKSFSGPIEDLEDYLKQVYDIFEAWSDIDDQAIVAKPFFQNVCAPSET